MVFNATLNNISAILWRSVLFGVNTNDLYFYTLDNWQMTLSNQYLWGQHTMAISLFAIFSLFSIPSGIYISLIIDSLRDKMFTVCWYKQIFCEL